MIYLYCALLFVLVNKQNVFRRWIYRLYCYIFIVHYFLYLSINRMYFGDEYISYIAPLQWTPKIIQYLCFAAGSLPSIANQVTNHAIVKFTIMYCKTVPNSWVYLKPLLCVSISHHAISPFLRNHIGNGVWSHKLYVTIEEDVCT